MAGENCKAMPFSLILVLSIHVSRDEGLAHLMEAQAKAKGSKARLVGWEIGSRTHAGPLLWPMGDPNKWPNNLGRFGDLGKSPAFSLFLASSSSPTQRR